MQPSHEKGFTLLHATSCPSGVKSDVFKGSTVAKFSYDACGFVDCYTKKNGLWDPRCPFDPTAQKT